MGLQQDCGSLVPGVQSVLILRLSIICKDSTV